MKPKDTSSQVFKRRWSSLRRRFAQTGLPQTAYYWAMGWAATRHLYGRPSVPKLHLQLYRDLERWGLWDTFCTAVQSYNLGLRDSVFHHVHGA